MQGVKKSRLSKIDVFSIVLGSIIGWGSFMLPGSKFLIEAGVINTTIGIFSGALFIIIIQGSYYIMLQNHDEEGGEFSYTYQNLGQRYGFLVGWFLSIAYLTIIPLNSTAFPLVVNKIFGSLFQFGYLYEIAGYKVYLGEILLSSFIVILFAYINIKGIKDSAKVQNFIILLLVIFVFTVFIATLFKSDKSKFLNNYINNYSFDIKQILRIFAITPFLFIGFDNIPQIFLEFDFDAKKASKIAVISIFVGAMIYAILNLTTALMFSPKEAHELDWALGRGVLDNLGIIFFLMLTIALTAAVTSGINGFMISTSKLLGSMANYNIIPKSLGKVNDTDVFRNAIIFATLISLIAPWFGREVILWIVDMSSLGAAIAYFFVSLISRRLATSKTFKIISLLGMLSSAIIVLLLLVPSSPASLGKESMIALVMWIILGLVFYFRVTKRKAA